MPCFSCFFFFFFLHSPDLALSTQYGNVGTFIHVQWILRWIHIFFSSNLINMHLCIASLSVTAHLECIRSIVQQNRPDSQRRERNMRFWTGIGVCVCACVHLRESCVSTPCRNPVPPLLRVSVVMSADCRLLWCLHLSSIWPTLGIWPGLIVLMVTPASCPQEGRPNSGPDIMKEM